MSLKLITLAAFAATAQAAACTAAETTKETECKAALVATEKKTPATKDTICKFFTDQLACYPQCACTADKALIDTMITTAQAAVKEKGGGDCPLKCGAGSALAPGMALTLALMVAARLYE